MRRPRLRPTPLALSLLLVVAFPAAADGPEPAERHRRWLEEADLLLTPPEREAFAELTRDYRRDAFIERFWAERDPFPETGRNEFREVWAARVALARERFGALTGDRARALLLAGPPQRFESSPCPEALQALEVWQYDGQRGGSFNLVFQRGAASPDGVVLWPPESGLPSLLAWSSRGSGGPDGVTALRDACRRAAEVEAMLERAVGWHMLERLVPELPQPSPEWAAAFLARSTELPPEAATFAADLDISYPGRHQSRTVVQGVISVPRGGEPEAAAASRRYVLDGEILRGAELFDQFRYRFEEPAATRGDRYPMVIQRYLRPGSYRAVVKVHDLTADRYFRVERDLEVPRVRPETSAAAAGAPAAGPAPPPDTLLAEATAQIDQANHSLTILPVVEGLLTGNLRIQAVAEGGAIRSVAFLLNGRPVMTKARPPYSVELNLGAAPRFHTVEAIGYDARGEELARDRVELNTGPHRFDLRLVEPSPGRQYRHSLRAQAEVEVPRGERLDRVEFFLDDALVATLYQPPWAQPIVLEEDGALAAVRAVATLASGATAEDVVLINAPERLEQVEVDFVELYTSVVDRGGRPVEELEAADFRVYEDGREQRLRRFERVRDLPIYAGLVIDASTSMAEEIDEAERAALKFFERVIGPRDRAAVFVFNDRPELRVQLTGSLGVLAGGLTDIRAEGETALYDTIVEGVYYFAGMRGKRALILLTDGEDSCSRHGFDETLDFARRSGIAIYAIGMGLTGHETVVRGILNRLAAETGGSAFFIDRVRQLDTIYQRIEEELRAQYLLGYQSSQTGRGGFREVKVEMLRPGLEARTIPGYFP